MSLVTDLARTINETFDIEEIIQFKAELKFIRSFVQFLRLQRNERDMRFPDKCRYLYNIAGSIAELADKKEDTEQWNELLSKAKSEWRRNYHPAHLLKLAQLLDDYDYSRVRPELFNNLFSRYAEDN